MSAASATTSALTTSWPADLQIVLLCLVAG